MTIKGKYELEIRLGLVFIVALLLLLNVSSAYILNDIKRQLTGELDNRLSAAIIHARKFLIKNQTDAIDNNQAEQIYQKFAITDIGTLPLPDTESDSLKPYLVLHTPVSTNTSVLDENDVSRLTEGNSLFYTGPESGIRCGLSIIPLSPGNRVLIYARVDSEIMESIGQAARMTFYLAIAVLILIIPIVITLPRQILKPFKKMHMAAQSAGRLIPTRNRDEVAEVIKSYETVINELKNNEAELERLYRESSTRADHLEKLNRYILKSIGSGVINVDLKGNVIGYNRAAMEILDYDEQMVLGKNYLVAFPREMELCLIISAGLERGEISGRKEIQLKRPDGSDLWLGVESSIILDDTERVIGVALLITDLTELKSLQAELEINRRMAALGEMTGGLAHQLRNSLAAISGFCQLLQKKTGKQSDIGEIAHSIRTEAADSEKMVSRFLTFAKPLSLTKEVFDLVRLTDECLSKFSADAASQGINLNLDQPREKISIEGDFLLLKEAVCNIIANGMEAAGQEGRVDIVVKPHESHLMIIIADNGPGIPESIKSNFFTPFVSSKPSGTGLGLALSRKIINLHKGTITLDSAHGQGTVCRINLPNCVIANDRKNAVSAF